MLKHKYQTALGILITAQIFTSSSTWAAPAVGFNQAVADYNAGKYAKALGEFKKYAAAYPKNAQSHYYLGLCYQAMGSRAEAREEFTLVTRCSSGPLGSYAQQALQALGTTSSSAPSSSAAAVALAAPSPAQASSGGRVAQVFDFYTDSCQTCKEFEPVWSETEARLRSVQFHRYNAEDPTNAALVQKYNVHKFPTLVYLDASGNVLFNHSGAPMNSEDFMLSINAAHR